MSNKSHEFMCWNICEMMNAFNLMSTDNIRKVSCYNRKLLSMEKNGLKLADWELKANSMQPRLAHRYLCNSISLDYKYFCAHNYFAVNTNVCFLSALNWLKRCDGATTINLLANLVNKKTCIEQLSLLTEHPSVDCSSLQGLSPSRTQV